MIEYTSLVPSRPHVRQSDVTGRVDREDFPKTIVPGTKSRASCD